MKKNRANFDRLVDGFIEKYDKLFPEFVSYFKQNYLNRCHQWAMCYRNCPHGNTDTNMYVEAFHNRLKTFYMDRKPIKRVDDLLNMLLKIEEDDFWRYKRETFYTNNADLCKTNLNRHEAGSKIPDTDISVVNDSLWKVKSQTSDQYYNVCKTAELSCYDHCYNKCLTITCMELCEHLYTCDCPDFNRICKHIYKIHSCTNRSSFQQYSSKSSLSVTISHSLETPLMNDNQLQESVTSPSGFNDHNKQILEFYKNLDEWKMLLQNKNVQVMRLAHVNLVLRDLINQCKALVDIFTDKLNQRHLN